MKNWKIVAGAACSLLALGAVAFFAAGMAWSEGSGIAPGLTAPRLKHWPMKADPADSLAKSESQGLPEVWKRRGEKRSGGSMPEYRPDPGTDYKILVIKPDPQTDYSIQEIRPRPEADGTVHTVPPVAKVWKSTPGGKVPPRSGEAEKAPESGSPKKP